MRNAIKFLGCYKINLLKDEEQNPTMKGMK